MRHPFACFTLSLTLCCVAARGQSRPSPSPAATHLIRAGTLIDGVSEAPGRTSSFLCAASALKG